MRPRTLLSVLALAGATVVGAHAQGPLPPGPGLRPSPGRLLDPGRCFRPRRLNLPPPSGCAPDLFVRGSPYGPSFCPAAFFGDIFTATAIIRNGGPVGAGASHGTARFVATQQTLTFAIPPIAAGQEASVSFPATPVQCGGLHDCHFTITVDSQFEVTETSETNNSTSAVCPH